MPEAMLAVWNRYASAQGLVAARALTPKRRTALLARLRDTFGGDLAGWEGYCERLARSGFCCGENDRGWRADLDFAIRPDSAVRALEGRYDNRQTRQPVPKLMQRWAV